MQDAKNPSHPTLVLHAPGGGPQTLTVRNELRVGRGPHNEVSLEAAEVSWSHAVFRVEPEGLVVEDLGSRNGTELNGVKIDQITQLRPGSTVSIGVFRFVFQGAPGHPTYHRLHIQDLTTGLRYTVRGGLFLIGDHDGCDLRIPGTTEQRVGFDDGQVTINGDEVEAPFDLEVGGRALRLVSSQRTYTPTAAPALERPLLLRVSLAPPEATIVDMESGVTSRVTAQTRVDFLWVLATALEEDGADDVADELLGWRSDEDVSLAIWGREGLRGSSGRLNTLTYRLRQELASAGFSRALIEKRSGWSRLNHEEMAVERG